MARQLTRDHVFHEITRSLCPECHRLIDAQVLIRDDAVYSRKRCPEHGWHESLVSSDAKWYLESTRYNRPGAIPHTFATTVERGCPLDCGLCAEHQQHTCIGILEVTARCNLTCPTCFADAGSGCDLSLSQMEAMLDRFVAAEGQPEVLQISGGEPTLHPQILDILAAAKARNIRHVMLNSNGLRLAREPEFARQLARYGPTIYLQFDGLLASTHYALRGRDLRAAKGQALENLAQAGLYAVLVATVAQGINDGEIGDILRYGLQHRAVLGVSYQPVAFTGRCTGQSDPLRRTTLTDVLYALERQTEGLLRVSDFRPVPCPHPACSACTYAYVHERQVIPIPRIVDVDDYLDFVTNRAVPNLSAELHSALEALWSFAAAMGSDKASNDLTCIACGADLVLPADLNLKECFFMTQVHGFMDEHTFDLKRLMKCCIHELLPDGRAVPFCAYNNLGYRQQLERERESGQ